MAGIDNKKLKTVNSLDSQLFMYALGRNLTTKEVHMYILNIVGKDAITGIGMMNYIPYVTQNTYVKTSDGIISGLASAESSDPAGAELSLKLTNDLNSFQRDNAYGNPLGLIENILLGRTFMHGNAKIMIVGFNGTNMMATAKANKCEIGHEYKNIFFWENSRLIDGMAITEDGEPKFKTNTFINKPNKEVKTFAVELYTLYDDETSETILLPYCYASEVTKDEDGTANKLNASIQKIGESWVANESIIYGAKKTFAIGDLNKSSFEVDYIAQTVDGITSVTDFGVSGDVIAVVNTTDASVKIYTSTGSAFTLYSGAGTFDQYAKITSNYFTTSTIATAVNQRGLIALKTASTANTGVASLFAEDSTGATKNYVCKFFIFDRESETVLDYAPTSTCN
jgi:hypothetical protein